VNNNAREVSRKLTCELCRLREARATPIAGQMTSIGWAVHFGLETSRRPQGTLGLSPLGTLTIGCLLLLLQGCQCASNHVRCTSSKFTMASHFSTYLRRTSRTSIRLPDAYLFNRQVVGKEGVAHRYQQIFLIRRQDCHRVTILPEYLLLHLLYALEALIRSGCICLDTS